jgi:hypothetical protein
MVPARTTAREPNQGENTMIASIGYLVALRSFLAETKDGDDLKLCSQDVAICADALQHRIHMLGWQLAIKGALGGVVAATGMMAILRFVWA